MSVEIATERLWLTATGSIVADGDPAAAFLLCAEGDEIPAGYAPPAKKSGKGRATHTPKPED